MFDATFIFFRTTARIIGTTITKVAFRAIMVVNMLWLFVFETISDSVAIEIISHARRVATIDIMLFLLIV